MAGPKRGACLQQEEEEGAPAVGRWYSPGRGQERARGLDGTEVTGDQSSWAEGGHAGWAESRGPRSGQGCRQRSWGLHCRQPSREGRGTQGQGECILFRFKAGDMTSPLRWGNRPMARGSRGEGGELSTGGESWGDPGSTPTSGPEEAGG